MKTNGKQHHPHGLAGNMFNEFKETSKDFFGEASKLVKKKTEELREKGLQETIKENPVGSVMVGVLAGFILGALFSRRD